jgi:hypothetical protein
MSFQQAERQRRLDVAASQVARHLDTKFKLIGPSGTAVE